MIPHRALFHAAVGLLGLLTAVGSSKKEPISSESYVGDSKCLSCHSDKQTYLQTAHHLTSSLPSQQSIEGSFSAGQNVLKTTNPDLSFRMDATASGFTEAAVIGTPPNAITHTERIDLVIGSGRKGHTYLYWKGDRLFELPVSYWTELNSWVDSPGHRDDFPNFERPVPPRCLECHASYFVSITSAGPSNLYKKTGFILGISCERCHGPGREHVVRQASGHAALAGEGIVQSSKAVPGPAGGHLRDVSCGHRNCTASSRILVHSRRTIAGLHPARSSRPRCQNRRSRKSGDAVAAKPLLSVLARIILLDLSQSPCCATERSRLLKPLSLLP